MPAINNASVSGETKFVPSPDMAASGVTATASYIAAVFSALPLLVSDAQFLRCWVLSAMTALAWFMAGRRAADEDFEAEAQLRNKYRGRLYIPLRVLPNATHWRRAAVVLSICIGIVFNDVDAGQAMMCIAFYAAMICEAAIFSVRSVTFKAMPLRSLEDAIRASLRSNKIIGFAILLTALLWLLPTPRVWMYSERLESLLHLAITAAFTLAVMLSLISKGRVIRLSLRGTNIALSGHVGYRRRNLNAYTWSLRVACVGAILSVIAFAVAQFHNLPSAVFENVPFLCEFVALAAIASAMSTAARIARTTVPTLIKTK